MFWEKQLRLHVLKPICLCAVYDLGEPTAAYVGHSNEKLG